MGSHQLDPRSIGDARRRQQLQRPGEAPSLYVKESAGVVGASSPTSLIIWPAPSTSSRVLRRSYQGGLQSAPARSASAQALPHHP